MVLLILSVTACVPYRKAQRIRSGEVALRLSVPQDEEEKVEEENAVKASSSADIINLFYKGNAEITDVVSVLQTEMPIIPVCYRLGVLFSKEGINIGDASQNDIFLNIK